MKLITCNGRDLRVYDVSGPVYHLTAAAVPIKCNGYLLLDDEAARDLVRELAKPQQC
jgi:hypothetical protein